MLVYLAKYEKAPGKHMPIPQHIPHEFTENLKKGVGVNSIKSLANEALRQPEWIDCLLDILTGHISWDRDGMRKAAWMLHHVYLLDERALFHHRSTLTTILDHTEDPSVLREVLKILGSPLWSDTETDAQRVELLQLGMDLMYDTSLPLGIHYTAIQLTSFRILHKTECTSVKEAMLQLNSSVGQESLPLRLCVERSLARLDKKWR
ncbi:hypothetical protein OAH92_00300 [bacterium]|nr:hypothetical protein [bacterium]